MDDAILNEKLRQRHIPMTAAAFINAVLEAVEIAPPDTDGTTTAELQFLREHGGVAADTLTPEAIDKAHLSRQRATAVATVELIGNSIDVTEAAALLRLDRSSINRRIQNRTLYAIRIDGRNRLPRWQFTAADTLPGLPVVVPAIGESVNPATVETIMRTPQEETENLTPIDYLISGGRPEPVAGILTELDRW